MPSRNPRAGATAHTPAMITEQTARELEDVELKIGRWLFFGWGLAAALVFLCILRVPWSGVALWIWMALWPAMNWWFPGPTIETRRARVRDIFGALARTAGDIFTTAARAVMNYIEERFPPQPADAPPRARGFAAFMQRPQPQPLLGAVAAAGAIPWRLVGLGAAIVAVISAVVGFLLIVKNAGRVEERADRQLEAAEKHVERVDAQIDLHRTAEHIETNRQAEQTERSAYVETVARQIEAPAAPEPDAGPGSTDLWHGAVERLGMRDVPALRRLPPEFSA